jgi:Cu/Ag efflux protein CusF
MQQQREQTTTKNAKKIKIKMKKCYFSHTRISKVGRPNVIHNCNCEEDSLCLNNKQIRKKRCECFFIYFNCNLY